MQGKKLPLFSCLCLLLVAAAVVLIRKPIGSAQFPNKPQSAAVPEAAKLRIAESYGKLPLSFELNRGQTDPSVKFLSRGDGYTLFLESTEAVLSLKKRGDPGPVLRMKLGGANPEPDVTGVEELAGKSNYFIGNDSAKWRTNVPTYARVKYQNVYPGIDLVYYGNQRQLEYDFVVAPGADPKAIQLDLEGADKIAIDAQGDLVLGTGAESEQIRLHKPLVYQETDGTRREIAGGFVLQNKQRVSFDIAAYDGAKPLVIDPVLAYATYIGGTRDNEIDSIAVDSSGNAYASGSTSSTDFPATAGAFQTKKLPGQPADGRDAFVVKLNPAGSALVWATYFGGSDDDDTHVTVVDSSGNVHITGHTFSQDMPTTSGAFQATIQKRGCGGASLPCDGVYVLELNPTGSALIYCTYLGGAGDDIGGLAVDSSGNAYLTGLTDASSGFPTTAGAFQTKASFPSSAGQKAWITKLNSTGSGLIYSTLLGGGNDENGIDLAIDSAGNAYVTGFTDSTDFPTTAGAFGKVLGPGNCGTVTSPSPCPDAFVTKLNPAGTTLVYSTYLGGNQEDSGAGIAIDSSGNAYVTGSTNSVNFPLASPFQNSFAAQCGSPTCTNAFITKLNPAGSALVYSTYFGGNGALSKAGDAGKGIAVDASGSAYVVGLSGSSNFPTLNPLTQVVGCPCPNYLAKLSPAGGLIYSTPISPDADIRRVVLFSGSAFVMGEADSAKFPATPGAFQTSFKAMTYGYMMKVADQAGSTGPTLTSGSLANGATYVAGGLVPGSWAQVKGSGLSNVTRIWGDADFVGLGNNLPTNLSGVEVKVNNLPAAVYYISSTQVSFQVPSGVSGTASVQVINNGVASNTVTGAAVNTSPGIFPLIVNGVNYPAGVFLDGKITGDPANGAAYRKAKAGDIIQLYVTGLAPTPAGVLPTPAGVSGVTVTIGNVTVAADFAGLVAVGEFQINFAVSQQFASLPEGTYPISITVNGVSSPLTINSDPPAQMVLPIQH